MSRLIVISTILSLLQLPCALAQYNFSVTTSPYVTTTGGTAFTPAGSVDTTIVPGFSLTIQGIANDTLFLRVPFTRINTQGANVAAVSFHAFDAEQIGGTREYTISGPAGNRVLNLQYKNIKFAHDWTGQDSINYQVWLYESDNAIEIHFGASSVLCPQSYYVPGIGTASGPAIGFEHMWLTGNPLAPTTSTGDISYLNGTPTEGTVYRFAPNATSIEITRIKKELSLYPNPATDILILPENTKNSQFIITDLNGRQMQDGHLSDGIINIRTLPPGAYLLNTTDENSAAKKYHFTKL